MLFISLNKIQKKIVENIRDRRLQMQLTQEGLSERSRVPVSTIRKFEQKGTISFDSLLKLLSVVGGLEEMVEVLAPKEIKFNSIQDVLKSEDKPVRKRGKRK